MAAVIGNAFSGFAKSVAGIKEPKSSHQTFIDTKLLPHTIKLQKETAWGRYKDAQKPLQEATLALKDFSKEEWPSKAKTKIQQRTYNGSFTKSPSSPVHAVVQINIEKATTSINAPVIDEDTKTEKTNTTTEIISEDDSNKSRNSNEKSTTRNEETIDVKHLTAEEENSKNDDAIKSDDTKVDQLSESPTEDSPESKTPDVATDTDNCIIDDNNPTDIDAETIKRTVNLLAVTSNEELTEITTITSSSTTTTLDSIISTKDEDLVHSAIIKTVEAYLVVLAHPSKSPRPTELALEGIAMVVDHQYLIGRAGGNEDLTGSGRATVGRAQRNGTTIPPPSLLHRVLEGISEISDSNSESVQTAVIKTLTSIVTAPACFVHEGSLLLAMRSTFRVFLVAKTKSCQDMARNSLLNMQRAVFIRMEAHEAVVIGEGRGDGQSVKSNETSKQNGRLSVDGIEEVKNGIANANRARSKTDDSFGTIGLTESSSPKSGSSFVSQYHADAYYLFLALCKLSSKELPADTLDESERKGSLLFALGNATDPTELNGKILSLELLLAAMDVCGSAFSSGDKFLFLVQKYLSGSLLKNCVSNQTKVAFLSQRIFLALVYKFKDHLKQDIEVFMTNVFFRVLESPNATFKQKALVLESLRTICTDPVILTQIFLNYDCDFNAMSLYKDIIQTLTKLGGKATTVLLSNLSKKEAEREFDLSLAALECLVNILKTFLRALGLPCGEESDEAGDIAGMRIRSILNLDQALAALPGNSSAASGGESVMSDSSHSVRVMPTPVKQRNDSSSATRSDVAGQIVDAFDRKRNAEQNFEIGSVKFTLSLKAGLNYFIDHGFVTLDAKEIALFFIANKDKLDKTQMGEALGREPHAGFVKDAGNVDAEKGGAGFWVRILHHYAESLDFSGIRFDEAIRLFLSGFRLPGEAQKIDRIMEKFAERYTAQNPEVFPSADTAFILAFSVIMLNTDLHNPSIKPERRMTVESFLRNNRGIGENGGDLPDDFLRGIFERIKASPFSLKEDDAARERVGTTSKQIFDTTLFFDGSAGLFGGSAEEKRRENFMKERDEMMAVTERLIKHRAGKNTSEKTLGSPLTTSIAPGEVVKPMFDITWGPVLGILSQVLECSDDERSVAVCLLGFVFAVRLAANSNMSLARDTFMSSLAKFTFLGSLKEMKRKNVESIRTLLSIAIADGEHLDESWGPVLQCISQLAKLRLSASGLDSDESFLMVDEPKKLIKRDASKIGMFGQQTKDEQAKDAEENNAKAVLEAVQEVLLDKVFSSTTSLSAKSLAHFIQQMIIVSSSEIEGTSKSGITGVEAIKVNSNHPDGPSIYMLQRLVDVADHNMNVRPRLVWTQVWDLMADFFAKNACHPTHMVSVFAIDSLKQLSLKFLDKPELSEFNFQSSFLKPFQVVIENRNSRSDIRELVLNCVDNIIRTKSQNLRSGWKILFNILNVSAFDEDERIEKTGLTILQRLLDDHLNDVGSLIDKHASEMALEDMTPLDKRNRNANVDEFICLCKASLSFLKSDNGDNLRPIGLTMRAFCHIAIYADLIASKRVLPPLFITQFADPQALGYTYSGLSENEALELVLWRPLFEGLVEGLKSTVSTSESGVGCFIQRASILTLRSILLRHCNLFSSSQLIAILQQTVLPAIQEAAERDTSHVVTITSESPLISNIDFLVDSLPLPPDPDDVELLQFEAQHNTLTRSWGPAELMLEASFTDLRYGGDGDLRKAYTLSKKSLSETSATTEQPFPDSWLATTASLALGLLTDVTSEVVIFRGADGRERIWPLISNQFRLWYLGREPNDSTPYYHNWSPCEALVRISCKEMQRLSTRLANDYDFAILPESEKAMWSSILLKWFSDLLAQSVEEEENLRVELLHLGMNTNSKKSNSQPEPTTQVPVIGKKQNVMTPYGRGRIERVQTTSYQRLKVDVDVIALDFGATLYRPKLNEANETKSPRAETEQNQGKIVDDETYSIKLVPLLKIRCVAAHSLQQILMEGSDSFIKGATKDVLSTLLHNLQTSRLTSSSAVRDEHISAAFQLLLLEEWGDSGTDPDEITESSARFSLLHGSSVYFLSQEASAIKASVHILSELYLSQTADANGSILPNWNRANFAESHLVNTIQEVLEKFIESERKEGHLVDVNMWRNTNEIGAKVTLYCTAYAPIVVETLKILRSMSADRFEKFKYIFFPLLCSLINVHSDEIRELVHQVFTTRVGPLIGIRA